MSAAACAFHYGRPVESCPSCQAAQPESITLPDGEVLVVAYDHDGKAIKSWLQAEPVTVANVHSEMAREAHYILAGGKVVTSRGCCGPWSNVEVVDLETRATEALDPPTRSVRPTADGIDALARGHARRVGPRLTGEADRTLHEQDAAREIAESLDVPDDSKARQKAVSEALGLLADRKQYRGDALLIEALEKAYDAGMTDCARLLPSDDPPSWDPMVEVDYVLVDIPGVRQERTTSGYWAARPIRISNDDGSEFTIYRIEGDPNAVAVGRFKASFRKFLGV